MTRHVTFISILLSATLAGVNLLASGEPGSLTPQELRCEYGTNPLGVDARRPRFSWLLTSTLKNQMQSEYRILVASSPQDLESNQGDLWDSGKITADRSVNVAYDGTKLSSGQKCHWKVRCWNQESIPGAWSRPASFEMGLLEEADWQGQWIGLAPPAEEVAYIVGRLGKAVRLDGKRQSIKIGHYPALKPDRQITIAAWIKRDRDVTDAWQEIYRKEDGNARQFVALGTTGDQTGVWFGLGIDGTFTEDCAPLDLATVNDGKWHLVAAVYDGKQKQVYVDGRQIGGFPRPGALDTTGARPAYIGSLEGRNEWFRGAVDHVCIYKRALSASEIESMVLGHAATDGLVGLWKFDGNLANSSRGSDGEIHGTKGEVGSILLRREFLAPHPITRARAHISGLGWYELLINGKKVGDHVLDPATTDYDKQTLYVTYDVTDMLHDGSNAIGIMLGNGWYSDPATRRYGESPRALLQMNIEYHDGSTMSLVTDESWMAARGPITQCGIWTGETYDARLEKSGWGTVGYDDSGWSKAIRKASPGGTMMSQLMPPIKVVQTVEPKSLSSPQKGVYVYDLGQLFGGWTRLRLKGSEGTKVAIKYSARRFADTGLLDKRRHRGGGETDYYILKGAPAGETYEPRFTYHPVRYVQVEGYPGKPTINDLEGRVVRSDVDMSGDFECANPLLNQIHKNVTWTLSNELFGMPLDCLHREHWAWTDPATVTGTLYPRKHMPLFWTKWLRDIRAAQRADGAVPDVCPLYRSDRSDPAWGGNYALMVWYLHQYYGDDRLLEEHYDGIQKLVGYFTSVAVDHVVETGHYGDHMLPGSRPGAEEFISPEFPKPLLWTGYYYRATSILARAARVLGKSEDARRYSGLAAEIRETINRRWFNAVTGQYATGVQTSNVFPLALGIVPEGHEAVVARNIVRNIREKYNGHHHAGNTGTTCLIDTLAANGFGEVMYGIASKTSYPGWGYMVQEGATTIWESWSLLSRVGDAESMSMWCTIDEFFYNDLAGIKGPDYYGPVDQPPGFKRVEIRPFVPRDLDHAGASINTVRGVISSRWRKDGEALVLDVTIPANSRGVVSVPKLGMTDVTVTEGGAVVWKENHLASGVDGVRRGTETDDYVTFDVGSGVYSFRIAGKR